ncbi:MAG: 50S ribosomal protein L18 [Planctomycetes bacterium]|nr:50S ribosomal protein L18 [Planctomycetota bacterium]
MDKEKIKNNKRDRRRRKIRTKISGTVVCPRLSVFKSNQHMYAQLIDDSRGLTIVAAHSREAATPKTKAGARQKEKKGAAAAPAGAEYELGKLLAKKAAEKKIKKAVFDRGGYKYHGRVKNLAEGARAGGLAF